MTVSVSNTMQKVCLGYAPSMIMEPNHASQLYIPNCQHWQSTLLCCLLLSYLEMFYVGFFLWHKFNFLILEIQGISLEEC